MVEVKGDMALLETYQGQEIEMRKRVN